MLQQTRAQTVIPYYEIFLARFPDPSALAEAPESEALAAWSGLGYYSRVRNLQAAARQIVELGRFPRDYDAIRELPGVGDYTAAAVSSIAFGLPRAVLDGNVLRVLARTANDPSDIASAATRKRFQRVADDLLDEKRPALFNQAIMELGATVCLPRAPLCLLCPVSPLCEARRNGTQAELPMKLRKSAAREAAADLVLIAKGPMLLLKQRPADSRRLAGFWELPELAEIPSLQSGALLGTVRHSIVDHRYAFRIHTARLPGRKTPPGFQWIDRREMGSVPVSSVVKKALRLSASIEA